MAYQALYDVGDRLWLKLEQEVVVVRQVIGRQSEPENRIPEERVRVREVRPQREFWYRVEIERNGQELMRKEDCFRPHEAERQAESD